MYSVTSSSKNRRPLLVWAKEVFLTLPQEWTSPFPSSGTSLTVWDPCLQVYSVSFPQLPWVIFALKATVLAIPLWQLKTFVVQEALCLFLGSTMSLPRSWTLREALGLTLSPAFLMSIGEVPKESVSGYKFLCVWSFQGSCPLPRAHTQPLATDQKF